MRSKVRQTTIILGGLASLGFASYWAWVRPAWQRRQAAYEAYFSSWPSQATVRGSEDGAFVPEGRGLRLRGRRADMGSSLQGNAAVLSQQVIDEVIGAFGFASNSWQRQVLAVFLRPISRSFAHLALRLDAAVASYGLGPAFNELLPYLVCDVQVVDSQAIPAEGPLLILANHPGAYDGPLIAASLPRQDLKIIVSTVPFLQSLPHFHSYLIEVTREASDGMRGARQAIRHLRQGGALLTFPSGIVDPDPDVLPGAQQALEDWKPSIELLLRRAPETQVVIAIASGVLAPSWLRSPLVRVQPESWRQRKLAEFLQVMQQAVLPGSLLLRPRVTFAAPVTVAQLEASYEGTTLHKKLIHRAQELLAQHMKHTAAHQTARGIRSDPTEDKSWRRG